MNPNSDDGVTGPALLVGVDIGGTHTVVLVHDTSGRELCREQFPGAYLPEVGSAAFEETLRAVSRIVRRIAGPHGEFGPPGVPIFAAFGLPGHGDITELTREHDRMLDLVFTGVATVAYNDVRLALEGAHGGEPGIIALSGTGSMVLGRDRRGRERRLGGLGPLLGDEGSAHAIAGQALRVAALAHDGRARATSLGTAALRHFGVAALADITLHLARARSARADLASFARIVDDCARTGDRAAQAVLRHAADELARQVLRLRRRLSADLPVSWAGGSFDSGLYRDAFIHRLGRNGVSAVHPPRHEPAFGGVLLARALGAGTSAAPKSAPLP